MEKTKIEKLTERQKEALIAYSEYGTYKKAAQSMGISFWTYRNHCHAIYQKLDVHNITQAIMFAFRAGIVE